MDTEKLLAQKEAEVGKNKIPLWLITMAGKIVIIG